MKYWYFVSQRYDCAKAGYSLWGDKLPLRKLLVQCNRTNSAETCTGYIRELDHLCQRRNCNYPDLLLRQFDPFLMHQWLITCGKTLIQVRSTHLLTTAGFPLFLLFILGHLNRHVFPPKVSLEIQCQRGVRLQNENPKCVSEADLAAFLSVNVHAAVTIPKANRDYISWLREVIY